MATPRGNETSAAVGGPPSPVYPAVPLPAIVVMRDELLAMKRTRLVDCEGDTWRARTAVGHIEHTNAIRNGQARDYDARQATREMSLADDTPTLARVPRITRTHTCNKFAARVARTHRLRDNQITVTVDGNGRRVVQRGGRRGAAVAEARICAPAASNDGGDLGDAVDPDDEEEHLVNDEEVATAVDRNADRIAELKTRGREPARRVASSASYRDNCRVPGDDAHTIIVLAGDEGDERGTGAGAERGTGAGELREIRRGGESCES